MPSTLNSSVREMRKQDVIDCFYNSFKEVRKEKPYATQADIIKHAVNSKAPRFYVTFENARRFISMMARKKRLPFINENKLAMYKEIYKRWLQQVKDCNRRYKYIILEKIIEEPAPSFYLDEESFRGIIYKTLRSRRSNYAMCHATA